MSDTAVQYHRSRCSHLEWQLLACKFKTCQCDYLCAKILCRLVPLLMCKGDYSKTSFWASGQPHCSLRAFMQHKRIALEWCAVTAEYLVVSLVCNVISCGPAVLRSQGQYPKQGCQTRQRQGREGQQQRCRRQMRRSQQS